MSHGARAIGRDHVGAVQDPTAAAVGGGDGPRGARGSALDGLDGVGGHADELGGGNAALGSSDPHLSTSFRGDVVRDVAGQEVVEEGSVSVASSGVAVGVGGHQLCVARQGDQLGSGLLLGLQGDGRLLLLLLL